MINCYWTLDIPEQAVQQKQRIVPDGCIEMAFILGDDIRRYTSKNKFIVQPRAMIIGQITKPFYIKPIGLVETFAIRFHPYGFTNFVSVPIDTLTNKELPINQFFSHKSANNLEQKIISAKDTKQRISIIENFLLERLKLKITIDRIVKNTVNTLLLTNGCSPINLILKNDSSKRRQLERNFKKQIGLSPKQLGKLIRLQTTLKMLLNKKTDSLTHIAHKGGYFDQSHFIKDFKEFTGTTPKNFTDNKNLILSSFFTKKL